MNYQVSEFKGGINQFISDTKLAQGEYLLLINGRTRRGKVEPIYLPEELNTPALTKVQGLYGFDKYLLLLGDGKAYVKDLTAGVPDTWTNIVGLSLNATVDYINAEAVPASTLNFKRTSIKDNPDAPVEFESTINGSSQCVIVSDGLNQPWLIFPNGSAREAADFSDWTNTESGREYVPKGLFVMYYNKITYMMGQDQYGKYTKLLRSISGRPVDFMINIKSDGEKGDPSSEAAGGAVSVSHAVSFEETTALARMGTPDGAIFIGTRKASFLTYPREDKLIFGEPTFRDQFLFNTGPLNHLSVLPDLLGDSALIDDSGIISFNATLAAKNEGKNLPFSAKIAALFEGVVQSITCCGQFQNYGLFAVNTIYGPGVMVYDTLNGSFTSLDIYSNVTGYIKQFAATKVGTQYRLFFITSNNETFEAFASDTVATCQLHLGEFATGDAREEQKPTGARCIFDDIQSDGTATVKVYCDKQLVATRSQDLESNYTPGSLPYQVPYPVQNADASYPAVFQFGDAAKNCWKFSLLISWNFKAALTYVSADSETHARQNSVQQAASLVAGYGQ